MNRRLAAAAALLALCVTAACSGSKAAPTTTVPPTTAKPTTTAAPTTTTAPRPMPLTGIPAKAGQDPTRPVLAVKVENDPVAYPLAGFEQADVVYEEVVEGGFTRFILLFQSQDAELVGSVRSVRPVDPFILMQFGKPILASSGGTARFEGEVMDAGVVLVAETADADADGSLFRRPDRSSSHDLYVTPKEMRQYVAAKRSSPGVPSAPPTDIFTFGSATTSTATPTVSPTVVSSVTVPFGSQTMQWKFEEGKWFRYVDGERFITEAENAVSTNNVAIMSVDPVATGEVDLSGSDVPSWTIIGEGSLTLLTTGGKAVTGTWSRGETTNRTRFLDSAGRDIPLAPGVTWIQLLPSFIAPIVE